MMAAPILALDVDGVLIEGFPRARWDTNMETDLGISPGQLQEAFFKPYWRDILVGRMPVEEPLSAFLESTRTRVSVPEFLAYWHGNDAALRLDVVEAANTWKSRTGGIITIATNQDLTRANYLRDILGLARHFDAAAVSCELGALKPEPTFFEKADIRFNRQPQQTITFIDDLIDNVDAANQHGWTALHAANPDEALGLISALNP